MLCAVETHVSSLTIVLLLGTDLNKVRYDSIKLRLPGTAGIVTVLSEDRQPAMLER